MRTYAIACWVLLVLTFCACETREPPRAREAPPNRPPAETRLPAISGLAHYRGELYLAVHDTKRGAEGPRLSLLSLEDRARPRYRPIAVAWDRAGGESHDLEAIHAVPDRDSAFVALESGDDDAGRARLIHLRAAGESFDDVEASIVGTVELPDDVHNLEGLAMLAPVDGLYALVLCERDERRVLDAESGEGRFALLGWSRLDLDGRRLLGPGRLVRARALVWPRGRKLRTCSGLYHDGEQLWLSAAVQPRDGKSFDSIVYRVKADSGAEDAALRVAWRVPDLKVEGLSRGTSADSGLAIASDEDEAGGTVRILPRAPG